MFKDDSLTRLIYVSTKDRYVVGDELKKLLNVAQQNNSANNITGILLFNSQYFFQALEGSRKLINELFHRISTDHRHNNIQILKMTTIDHRKCENWSMAFISIDDIERRIYQKYTNQLIFNPYDLDSRSVDDFLTEICVFHKEN